MSLSDRAFALLQHLLPKHLLSRVIYALTRSEQVWIRNLVLGIFLRGYRIDMSLAVEKDPYRYPSFNAFFTRALHSTARPIDAAESSLVSPVDGTVSQSGLITHDTIVQAKGRDYSMTELLGGDDVRAAKYLGGSFACIYLAPYNYHRIHMPLTGTVRETIYIPGDLFSVNAATARAVPRVFARNERVVCDFVGTPPSNCDFAMVFVGALHVGSIETTWCGEINPPPRPSKSPEALRAGQGRVLAKGDEAGRFNMGST
ncbi:MAG: phosphatidylserine decarboxylase, partial [Candidatus Obscuribacterales bacterium]|nr:phosphatidylserine decarboxylase [Steroidobacteraceae bacterium]